MQTLQINATLQSGKYTITKVLGQGGFGITYLAEHNLLGTKVAIKEFFMKELNNRDESTSQVSVGSEGSRELVMRFRDKFIKEARNIARLNHPNIIRIHDVFEENGTAYYIMEYCDGESLNELLKMHPAGLGEALAVKYIRQIASALQYIHERKMNHLDVKPANIMLNAGNAVLIDFGLSKQYDSTGSQTSTTPVGISHGFAPIEQYKQGGVSEFSPATDIYSLGATLFNLITGQTPPDALELNDRELPLEVLYNKGVSIKCINVIKSAMQPRKKDRMKTAKEFISGINSQNENHNQIDETTSIIEINRIHKDIPTLSSNSASASFLREEKEKSDKHNKILRISLSIVISLLLISVLLFFSFSRGQQKDNIITQNNSNSEIVFDTVFDFSSNTDEIVEEVIAGIDTNDYLFNPDSIMTVEDEFDHDVLTFLKSVYPNKIVENPVEGVQNMITTNRCLEYFIECDADPIYNTQDSYSYDVLPYPTFSKFQPYPDAYKVVWYNGLEYNENIVVLKKINGQYYIDNFIRIENGRPTLLFDYSKPPVSAYD